MKYFAVAVIAASWASVTAAVFNAKSNTNVVTYWGQGPNQPRLVEICKNVDIDIVNIAFVTHWGPGKVVPATNFGNQCGTDVYVVDGKPTKLLSYCPNIGPDITTCQETYGKKILLSLGGDGNPNYYLEDTPSAKYLTEFLWSAFGPVTDAWTAANGPRPFGDAVVDGFDFDIESNRTKIPVDSNGNKINDWASRGYAKMAQHFRDDLFPRDPTKTYYLSGSPQCSYPDPHLNPAIKMAHFDFLFIQFYNTPACSARAGVNHKKAGQSDISFVAWAKALKGTGTKLYFGLPASPKAVPGFPNHYLAPKAVQTLLQRFMPKYSKQIGGISLWEATYARNNVVCNAQYFHWMKKALQRTIPGGVAARAEGTLIPEIVEERAACNPWAGKKKSKREADSGDEYSSKMYSYPPSSSSTSFSAFSSSSPIQYQTSTVAPSVYMTSPTLYSTDSLSRYPISTQTPSTVSSYLPSLSTSSTPSSSPITSSSYVSTTISDYTTMSYTQSTSEITLPSSRTSPMMTYSTPSTTQIIESTSVLTGTSKTKKPYTSSTYNLHPTTSNSVYLPKTSPTKYVSTSETSKNSLSSATPSFTSKSIQTSTKPETLYTTVITTTFIDVCPTGLTTKTATYHSTVKSGTPSSTGLPTGWTITETLCTQCGPTPTQVTITRPTYPSIEETTTTHQTSTSIITLTSWVQPSPTSTTSSAPDVSLSVSSASESKSHTFHVTRTHSLVVTSYTTAPSVQSSGTSTVTSTTIAETTTNINYVTVPSSKPKSESPTTLVSYVTPVSVPELTTDTSMMQPEAASPSITSTTSATSKTPKPESTNKSTVTSIDLPVIVTTYAPSPTSSAIPYSTASSSLAAPEAPTNNAGNVQRGFGLVMVSIMTVLLFLI